MRFEPAGVSDRERYTPKQYAEELKELITDIEADPFWTGLRDSAVTGTSDWLDQKFDLSDHDRESVEAGMLIGIDYTLQTIIQLSRTVGFDPDPHRALAQVLSVLEGCGHIAARRLLEPRVPVEDLPPV